MVSCTLVPIPDMTDVWLMLHRSYASFPVWTCFHLLCFCVMGQSFWFIKSWVRAVIWRVQIYPVLCLMWVCATLWDKKSKNRLQKFKTSEMLSTLKIWICFQSSNRRGNYYFWPKTFLSFLVILYHDCVLVIILLHAKLWVFEVSFKGRKSRGTLKGYNCQ